MKKFLIFFILCYNYLSILVKNSFDITSKLQIEYYVKDNVIRNLKIQEFYIGL